MHIDDQLESLRRQAIEHKKALRYAGEHWDDSELQATAKAVAQELEELAALEAAAGLNLRSRDDYSPGCY